MRGLKNTESANEFIQGFLVHYNYIRPHTSLNDRTPAEVAGINYPYKDWADITRHKPSVPVVIEHQPRGKVRLPLAQIGRRKKRIRISKKAPRITPKPSQITQVRGLKLR
ncbi:integrase core domain-containing protein [Chloroflexota bacterium]